jgi:branched-chain amino acid transport system ATP-binding protein
MIKVEGLNAFYGRAQALWDIHMEAGKGELVAIVGPNGAGKSTLLRALTGLVPIRSGRLLFQGQDISAMPAEKRVRLGLSMIPEGREVFADLTVVKNLRMGAFHRLGREPGKNIMNDLQGVYSMFPRLEERAEQKAGTLSGGEQQMLAIGRALMAHPKMILMDEPSLGLAPLLVKGIFKVILNLQQGGFTFLVVEQNARQILKIAKKGYVLQGGKIIAQDTGDKLLSDPEIVAMYLLGTQKRNG